MQLGIFTSAGAAALAEALTASDRYRQAATDWRGSLLLEVTVGEDTLPRALLLDLRHGTCRCVDSTAVSADRERADYILGAPEATWEDLLGGRLDLLTALFGGRLRLERGRILGLAPHLDAARELLAVAAEVNRQLRGTGT